MHDLSEECSYDDNDVYDNGIDDVNSDATTEHVNKNNNHHGIDYW